MKYLNADGLKVKVDNADYITLSQYLWHIKWRTPHHPYVYRYEKRALGAPFISRFRPIRLHRQILGFPSLSVDHVNGDPLDNRRKNLRLATQQQQAHNTRHRNGKQYKGVSSSGSVSNPWRARIRINGDLIGLGVFDNPEDAAKAYNKAARKHFGEFACLNRIMAAECVR